MAKAILENETDSLDLDSVAQNGYGVQLLRLSGVGLPPVSVQWVEGAGDGATYRSSRALPRDQDMELDIKGTTRAELRQYLSRLAAILAKPATLRLQDEDGSDWSLTVVRVGGGDFSYTAGKDVQTVLTVRSGDPFWTASNASTAQVGGGSGVGSFVSSLLTMPLASSQAIGTISMENIGDVAAYPIWEVYGPGNNFKAISPTGETLWWTGSLSAGEKLIIDTKAGTVVDGTGANRYSSMATAPRFWPVPPGTFTATASLLDTTSASKIVCSWRARRWMVS
jgi:hypothetical protein